MGSPQFFRVTGFVCLALASLLLAGSLIGLALGRSAWFDGVLLFLIAFLVAEATAVVLVALRRVEIRLESDGETEPSDQDRREDEPGSPQ